MLANKEFIYKYFNYYKIKKDYFYLDCKVVRENKANYKYLLLYKACKKDSSYVNKDCLNCVL